MQSNVLPTYNRAPLSFVSGEGCWLTDESGDRYLDAGAGIAVSALGHAHPKLVKALADQASRLWHTSNLYVIPNQEKLADLLVEHTFADTAFFTNSGTEAMEAAVKMARKYWHHLGHPERHEVIALNGSFHGRTLAMISAAGAKKLVSGFAPLMPGFKQIDPEDIKAAEVAVDGSTAAIMVEPIIGEGGIIPLSDSYMKGLRALCDEKGILLILDEIQCGMGRTGKLFAHELSGIEPDIMAIAKGIGGGFPLGACLAKSAAAVGMTAGTHGSTYGGNPLACAVGAAVLGIVADEEFLEGVRRRSGFLRQRLEAIAGSHPEIFAEVRGTGMMIGMVCKVPNMEVVDAGYRSRILTVPAGDNSVRILPPLNIGDEDVAEITRRIEKAAEDLEGRRH